MFGRRADGVKVKNLDIIEKATPYFMPMRIDAVQLYTQPINLDILDEWIQKEKRRSGVHYSYTELFIAAAVRMLYERPKTNRFINDCVIYQRKWISISMAVKQKLTDDSAYLAQICDCCMEMDRGIAAGLGWEMNLEGTIASGDGKCRMCWRKK